MFMATLIQWRPPRQATNLLGDEVQQRLARWNHARLEPRLPDENWERTLEADQEMLRLEGSFLDNFEPKSPIQSPMFRQRLKLSSRGSKRSKDGPGQRDPLFPWLAERAISNRCDGSGAGSGGRSRVRRPDRFTQVKRRPDQARTGAQLLGRNGPRQCQGHARADARPAG